ncbi:hypothetical protein IR148_09200 [Dysgonomonas mossii]|uniref:AAA domain-containing protein n=1 Tax=Dysgonomonas mossii TaxID=163665 RepID=A0A4Y9INT2_9BACT|nr:hypothetical protein [Dysgonomonas mossii]MBF0761218.1 hypothetical protein [Dysgonomonas mossii]TFU90173.1 hypothetical protein E4T88_09195 [Dysgonomonas mossii]
MHLIIRNVGPIKNVDINLNKINIIIGPQSSGKSTINKIACYLSWVEKKICVDQSFDFFYSQNVFLQNLEVFHNLEDYVNEKSYIKYVSDVLSIEFNASESSIPKFSWNNRYEYKRPKISYIPAERNVVSVIPNWIEVTLPKNNIKNYMTDWNEARYIYDKEHPLFIESLDIEYYYDNDLKNDFITILEDNDKKKIKLTTASSGTQSLIPIYVLIGYFLKTINNTEELGSIKEDSANKELESKLTNYLIDKEVGNSVDTWIRKIDEFIKQVESLSEEANLKKKNSKLKKIIKSPIGKFVSEASELRNNYLKNNHLKLFLEEPESNLFPSTQQQLLYYLVEQSNTIEDSILMITTHSPFILYALNNCILGGQLKDITTKNKSFHSYKSWIDPDKVSIWEIYDGQLKDIKDSEQKVIGQHYFNDIMGDTLKEYSNILKCFKK